MKKNFTNIMPEATEIWKGGGDAFMSKGTNGGGAAYYRIVNWGNMMPRLIKPSVQNVPNG
ncbi:MAG: hypothetical protein ACJAQ6_001326 [Arenicella sp.]|jgi:hypothetical protein